MTEGGEGTTTVFPYIPNSVPEIKTRMLREVDAKNEMDLYSEIPEHLRFKRELKLPKPILDEYDLRRHVESLLEKNNNCKDYLTSWALAAHSTLFPLCATRLTDEASSLPRTWGNRTQTTASGKLSLSTAVSWANCLIWTY